MPNKGRIKLNKDNGNFTSKTNVSDVPVKNNLFLPHENLAQYLGMNLEVKKRWRQ